MKPFKLLQGLGLLWAVSIFVALMGDCFFQMLGRGHAAFLQRYIEVSLMVACFGMFFVMTIIGIGFAIKFIIDAFRS